jgi:signal transduction histidine kinase/CheY-like chemotaxis protein
LSREELLHGLSRAPGWLALACIAWVTLSISMLPIKTADVLHLSGVWQHGEAELRLPAVWEQAGKVELVRTVEVTQVGTEAIWLEAPLYAAELRWDGTLVARQGDPHDPNGARSGHSIFALLGPVAPGPHTVQLTLHGAYGKTGTIGQMVLGPMTTVHTIARHAEARRLALSLGLCLLAVMPLVVATRRSSQIAFQMFGLFCTALAALAFLWSDSAHELIGSTEVVLRMRRLFAAPIGSFAVAFAASLLYGTPRTAERWLIGVGLVVASTGLWAPSDWLYITEMTSDSLFLVTVPWFLSLLLLGTHRRVPGMAALLFVGFVPVVFGLVTEVLLTHGLRSGGSYLFTSSILLAAGAGTALMLRSTTSAEHYRRLVQGAAEPMVCVDRDGTIYQVNPAAQAWLEPGDQDNLLTRVLDEDQPLARAHVRVATKRRDTSEFRIRTATLGERAVESQSTPLDDGQALLMLRDVTARRTIDKGMLRAARMETVAVLLGGIAHDVNNMLGTLLAHVGVMAALGGPKDRLDRMEATIDRASHLTRRLLTVARGTGAELDTVQIQDVCRTAVDLVEPTLRSARLVVDVPDGIPPIHGSERDLEQVLVNLLVNAHEAIAENGEKGTIRMVARAFHTPNEGMGVALMVQDDGPGLSDSVQDRIFEPFVTTKGTGTGLGLAVSKQILDDHYGRIWVEKVDGGGARFVLVLRHADVIDDAPAPLPDGRLVVLVEDEPVLLEAYAKALEQAGYRVVPFSNAREALRWTQEKPPDLLVTDVMMTPLNGLDLARQVQKIHPHCPVLFVSAFVPDPNFRELLGSHWMIAHKPVRMARLVAMAGRLRRRVERAERGELDITHVTYTFPPLEGLTAQSAGLLTPPKPSG